MSGIPVNDHEIFMQKASEYIEYPENLKKQIRKKQNAYPEKL